MHLVYLGLGSNVNDRLCNLSRGIAEIRKIAEIKDVSSIYETEPVEMNSKNMFYNMALAVETSLTPPELLPSLRAIEKKLGRRRHKKLADRTLDIDILLYQTINYHDHDLQVPHPRMEFRRFVLEPLSEIAADEIHTPSRKSIANLLAQCPDGSLVCRTPHTLTLIP